jgi:hypothetical protein
MGEHLVYTQATMVRFLHCVPRTVLGKENSMTANDWRVCPKCQNDLDEAVKAAELALEEWYGILPLEGYSAKQRELRELEVRQHEGADRSVPEYYEIYLQDGHVVVDYEATCTLGCGYHVSFTHREPDSNT